ncbi:hypothetical protein [Spartinivicinus ruber]|uniref:hypothetical protein n=1 Tax=Spartinivicinus ruber TaxID=2683272 RepID=UPI0013D1E3F0|nr:hypothetical protein [Spartinivicinus ruber]
MAIDKPLVVYFFSLAITFASSFSQPAHAGYVEECYGCHTSSRDQPIDGVFPNGFGHWRDSQCYGCHREINDIAINLNKGIFDKRLFALPVSRKRLTQLNHSPLSYMHAPQQVVFTVDGVPRFEFNNLFAFLQQPVSLNRKNKPFTTMMAYPKLTKQQLKQIINKLNNRQNLPNSSFESIKTDETQALMIWNQQCKSCHETTIAPYDKQGLSLFSADWIYNYANGLVKNPNIKRTMPVLKLTKSTAKGLKQLFSQFYKTAKQTIKKQNESTPDKLINTSTKLNNKAISYIWGRFFRDGMCVHCHGIEGRAKQYFDATNNTTISHWLNNNSPWKIWRRLELRSLEIETGIQSHTPGMPMSAPALPQPMRQLFANWISQNCPDLSGNNHCNKYK